jgi:hypothetical protein
MLFDIFRDCLKKGKILPEKKSRGDNDEKMRNFPLRRVIKIARDKNLIHFLERKVN